MGEGIGGIGMKVFGEISFIFFVGERNIKLCSLDY